MTALVASLLDEGLKCRRFPGVVYRDGPYGRRAGLIRGLDVWQVIDVLQSTPGRGEQRLRGVAEGTGLELAQVRLAVDFYAAFPEEIDRFIADNDRAAIRVRDEVERRERLLTA